ncbi:hypothetical protein, partial [Bradyrhizobium liaoningense]|uniref:hypothetical protein n=1 Tax=Bradyrhizobium liaoningense TaxID=43992 RepID=UPI001BAC4988
GSGRLVTRLDTPPSSHRHHPDSAIAPVQPPIRIRVGVVTGRKDDPAGVVHRINFHLPEPAASNHNDV